MNPTEQTNDEAIVIDNYSDYEALSMAWEIEEQTGDVDVGMLQMSDMPRMYRGDLSNRLPVITDEDLEEVIELTEEVIETKKDEIDNYNAANAGSYDVSDVVSDRQYTGIHDASELEQMAKEKELRQMDKDGLYVKLSVSGYDSQGLPKLKATRWDGEALPEQDLLDNIAHYVADMKMNRNKIPLDVGEAILCMDRHVLDSAYGNDGRMQIVNDVLGLMTNSYNRKVA